MKRSPTFLAPLLGALLVPAAGRAAERIDFQRDIRPILSDFCFKCHGPDDKARKSKLRLDSRDTALKGGRSGESAIVPRKPDASELIRRVSSKDETEAMPPPQTGKKLSARQIQLLRNWIADGANYKVHWAYVPPVRPPLPLPSVGARSGDRPQQGGWARNPIDLFVLARQEREGLHPSPPASKETLIRRLSLDLLGLPPTPAEVDAFLADRSPDAYERLVDRLLASPAYGERWGRHWLDAARYADSDGYEKDTGRPFAWRYRHWLIAALNAKMPYDQFTIEQLAGDLLPKATTEQKVATGFHRNTQINQEGGIDQEQFRVEAVVDRTNTTGTVWLGLTVGCAQCHDHKFDPLSQREYYQLFAFFNSADEPSLEILTPEQQQLRQQVRAQLADVEGRLKQLDP